MQFATVNMTAGNMQLNAPATYTIAGLTGTAGTIKPNTTAGTYTLAVNSAANTTYAGTLANNTGVLALRTRGTGVLTINAANTYSGGTTVNAGTLAIGPAGNLGTGNVTITPGAVLDVSAFGSGYNLTSGVLSAGARVPPAPTSTAR